MQQAFRLHEVWFGEAYSQTSSPYIPVITQDWDNNGVSFAVGFLGQRAHAKPLGRGKNP